MNYVAAALAVGCIGVVILSAERTFFKERKLVIFDLKVASRRDFICNFIERTLYDLHFKICRGGISYGEIYKPYIFTAAQRKRTHIAVNYKGRTAAVHGNILLILYKHRKILVGCLKGVRICHMANLVNTAVLVKMILILRENKSVSAL